MENSSALRKASDEREVESRPSLSKSLLPPDFMRASARRLGWIGLIYAAGYSLIYFVPRLTLGPPLLEFFLRPQSIVATASILLGITVFLLASRTDIAPRRLLNLGLVFEVTGSLGIAMSEFWGTFPAWSEALLLTGFLGIPWEVVLIIAFPLLAPNTPGKTLVASLAAASAGPLTIVAATAFGEPLPDAPLGFVAGYFAFTTYLCAGIAYLVSRNIVEYGAQLKKARDVGSYQLVERLGYGGMGEVWAATHRMLARPAAVKVIRPEILGSSDSNRETAIMRFQREAKATAALGSPHTVAIYDFGITEEGSFFYVMELLNGLNLEELIKRFGPLAPARAAYFLTQICDSLSEAHTAGLIHRDVKPANIFTCHVGNEFDFVKVLDFGLVKSSHDPDKSPQITGDAVTGTPGYMAPEQALDTSSVDQRTDLYALGCVAYWLLTGNHVFTGNSPIETIFKHVNEQPAPPSQRSEIEIPLEFDQLVLDCLSKNPTDRPQSAAVVCERLKHCLGVDDWSSHQATEWWKLNLPERTSIEPRNVLDLEPQEVLRVLR